MHPNIFSDISGKQWCFPFVVGHSDLIVLKINWNAPPRQVYITSLLKKTFFFSCFYFDFKYGK